MRSAPSASARRHAQPKVSLLHDTLLRGLPRRPGLPQVSGVLADTPATLAVAADCTSDRGLSAAGVFRAGCSSRRSRRPRFPGGRFIFWSAFARPAVHIEHVLGYARSVRHLAPLPAKLGAFIRVAVVFRHDHRPGGGEGNPICRAQLFPHHSLRAEINCSYPTLPCQRRMAEDEVVIDLVPFESPDPFLVLVAPEHI